MILVRSALAAALAFVAASPARAEVTIGPGAIGATIRDPNDRVVAGAVVTADGPVVREATSSAAGVVTLDALPLGTYTLRVARAGFRPYARRISLGASGRGIALVAVEIVPANLVDLRAAADDANAPASGVDALAARVVARDVGANVVPARSSRGATVAIAGAGAGESRLELDGIPLAGESGSVTSLRARDGLGLASVDLVRGPALPSTSLRNAIGGIVAYRTPETSGAFGSSGALGYDAAIGPFETLRTNVRVGKLRALADLVDGRTLRSQTVKTTLDLSRSLSVGFAQYGAQASLVDDGTATIASAPAFAADVRATLGRTTLTARAFESASNVDVVVDRPTAVRVGRGIVARTPDVRAEDARVRGLQLAYAIACGDDALTVAFDRRIESDLRRDATRPNRTYTTLSARTDVRLSDAARLEIADAYAGGTSVPPRHDPSIALALRTDPRTTLRASVGSAYAPAPPSLVTRASQARASLRPETSFELRVQLDEALADGGRAWIALDDLRRYERFAATSDARATGLEVGYVRPPFPHRIDATLEARFEHARTFGTSPATRDAFAGDAVASGLIDATPSSKARVTVGYSDGNAAASVGITAFGGNNPLGPHPVTLGDAHVRVRVASVVDVRLGVENAFGFVAADPRLAPLFAPHEVTLTIGSAHDP